MKDRRHEALCDGIVLAFGLWTLLCQVTVFLGGNLVHLLGACALVAPTLFLFRRRLPRAADPIDSPEPPESPLPPGPRSFAVLLALALVPAIGYWRTHDPILLWWLCLPALLASGWMLAREGNGVVVARSPRDSRAIWGLAIAMAVLAVASTHSDADDTLYLSFATWTADSPGDPLLARDGVLGRDLPLLLGVYRVHSFEVLGGALAYLTRTPVLWWMHLVFPFLGAIVAVLALGWAAKQFAPRQWFWVTLVAVAYLVLFDQAIMSHGNHGFARLFQGKSLMLSAMFPLALAHALAYVRQPSLRRWILLLSSQIAAVGLSVNALSLLPIMIPAALLAGSHRRNWKATEAGLLTLVYPLGLLRYVHAQAALLRPDWTPPDEPAAVLGYVIEKGIGEPALAGFVFLVLLVAWSAASDRASRRALWLVGTVFLLVFFNPFLAVDLIALTERRGVYPRAIWIVPLPLLIGILSTTPLRIFSGRRIGWASTVALVIVVFALLPRESHLFSRRGGWFTPPGPKVPAFFDATRRLAELAGPGDYVLAPPHVSAWLPALRHHPYPLYSREIYHELLAAHLGAAEADRRRSLALAVSNDRRVRLPAGELHAALRDYDVTAVCLGSVAAEDMLRGELRRAGFVEAGAQEAYEFWSRTPAASTAER